MIEDLIKDFGVVGVDPAAPGDQLPDCHIFDDVTINGWIEIWTRNAAINRAQVPENARTLTHIKNTQWGKEAAILSSGPSLDNDLRYLKDFKGLIISGNSSANPCVAYGIKPDWTVILDADAYVVNQFDGLDISGWKVILPTMIDPGVPKLFNPDLTWWFNIYDYRHWFLKYGLHYIYPKVDALLASCSVTGAMIRLAHWMGVRRVYLLGADFGFPQDRHRCSVFKSVDGQWEREEYDPFCEDKSTREVINGIETTAKLKVTYAAVINMIQAIKKTDPAFEVIDCSHGLMREFPKKEFKEVVGCPAVSTK